MRCRSSNGNGTNDIQNFRALEKTWGYTDLGNQMPMGTDGGVRKTESACACMGKEKSILWIDLQTRPLLRIMTFASVTECKMITCTKTFSLRVEVHKVHELRELCPINRSIWFPEWTKGKWGDMRPALWDYSFVKITALLIELQTSKYSGHPGEAFSRQFPWKKLDRSCKFVRAGEVWVPWWQKCPAIETFVVTSIGWSSQILCL